MARGAYMIYVAVSSCPLSEPRVKWIFPGFEFVKDLYFRATTTKNHETGTKYIYDHLVGILLLEKIFRHIRNHAPYSYSVLQNSAAIFLIS
jgi:hypothetical protein